MDIEKLISFCKFFRSTIESINNMPQKKLKKLHSKIFYIAVYT